MATYFAAKTPAEVVERVWSLDDSPQSVSTSADGITVDSATVEDDGITFVLSGGTAAATATVEATATYADGLTRSETFYVPVIESAAQIADTARDYINFALRKVVGIGDDASPEEFDDALERLNGLVAAWRAGGADIGASFPITAGSVIYCPDYAAQALRYNLLLDCYSLTDAKPTAMDVERARRGLQLVKHRNLPADRSTDFY